MVKDKDKLFIECECVDRCSLITIEYLKCYEEFFLNFYRKYSFKHKNGFLSFSFTKKDAGDIIEYFQIKPEDRKEIFIECKTSDGSSGYSGMNLEWMEQVDMGIFGFYRKNRFNRKKVIYGPTFSEAQINQIIEYLQKKREEVSS